MFTKSTEHLISCKVKNLYFVIIRRSRNIFKTVKTPVKCPYIRQLGHSDQRMSFTVPLRYDSYIIKACNINFNVIV